MRGERDSIPDSSEDTLHHVIRPILMPCQPSVECVQAAIDRGQSDQAGQDNLSPHLVQNIKKKGGYTFLHSPMYESCKKAHSSILCLSHTFTLKIHLVGSALYKHR